MITVTSHEFRSNQKKYLDRVAQGVELLLTRKNESFKIVKASEDDARMGKEEFLAKIEKAISDVRDGKSFSMKPGESLDGFLERMEAEGHVQLGLPRQGWAEAAKRAHENGDDKLLIPDVFEDENFEDWTW